VKIRGGSDTYAAEPGTSSARSWHLVVLLFAFECVVSHEDCFLDDTLLRLHLFYLLQTEFVSKMFRLLTFFEITEEDAARFRFLLGRT
jgi:hypothetical protein